MKRSWTRRWLLSTGTAAIAFGCVAILRAQYPGHIDLQKKASTTSTLRSVAVAGVDGRPQPPQCNAAGARFALRRENLQDGALYLARPVPLALDSGTEYEVQGSGLPRGWFDIDGAREIGDDWFGFGNWKPYVPPPPKKFTRRAIHPPWFGINPKTATNRILCGATRVPAR